MRALPLLITLLLLLATAAPALACPHALMFLRSTNYYHAHVQTYDGLYQGNLTLKDGSVHQFAVTDEVRDDKLFGVTYDQTEHFALYVDGALVETGWGDPDYSCTTSPGPGLPFTTLAAITAIAAIACLAIRLLMPEEKEEKDEDEKVKEKKDGKP